MHFCLTHINNQLVTNYILEKYIFVRKEEKLLKVGIFSDLELDPYQLSNETDPRIRIRIKLKRIRNTAKIPTKIFLSNPGGQTMLLSRFQIPIPNLYRSHYII